MLLVAFHLAVLAPLTTNAGDLVGLNLSCATAMNDALIREETVDEVFDDYFNTLSPGLQQKIFDSFRDKLKNNVLQKCNDACSSDDLIEITRSTLESTTGKIVKVSHVFRVVNGFLITLVITAGAIGATYIAKQHNLPDVISLFLGGAAMSVLGQMLAPVLDPMKSKTVVAANRLVRGKSILRHQPVLDEIDKMSAGTRSKFTQLQVNEMARVVSPQAMLRSDAKESLDFVLRETPTVALSRIAGNLAGSAVYAHRYFEEVPVEYEMLAMHARVRFTLQLPDPWNSEAKRLEIFNAVIKKIREVDPYPITPEDVVLYRTMIKKWLDLN